MPTITFPMFGGTGHAHKFLKNFKDFRVAIRLMEMVIIQLLFTHLKGAVAEWYAAEVGMTPLTSSEKGVEKFSSHCRGGPPNEGSSDSQNHQDKK